MVEIFIQGNLVKDAEVKQSQNGNKYVSLKVASNGFSKGEKRVDYYDITWFNYSEKLIEWLKKGKPVTVVGDFHASASLGRDSKIYVQNDVVAHNVSFIDVTRGDGQQTAQNTRSNVVPTQEVSSTTSLNLPVEKPVSTEPVENNPDNDLPF